MATFLDLFRGGPYQQQTGAQIFPPPAVGDVYTEAVPGPMRDLAPFLADNPSSAQHLEPPPLPPVFYGPGNRTIWEAYWRGQIPEVAAPPGGPLAALPPWQWLLERLQPGLPGQVRDLSPGPLPALDNPRRF